LRPGRAKRKIRESLFLSLQICRICQDSTTDRCFSQELGESI
jgi:hypothetical protein